MMKARAKVTVNLNEKPFDPIVVFISFLKCLEILSGVLQPCDRGALPLQGIVVETPGVQLKLLFGSMAKLSKIETQLRCVTDRARVVLAQVLKVDVTQHLPPSGKADFR
jgi:hypothetical protein